MAARKGPDEPYRILMLGGTGAGKSSLGNSLLGKKEFMALGSINSATKKCSMKEGKMPVVIEGRNKSINIKVWDTPGLFDTHEKKEETIKLIADCLGSMSPGPHVVLMVAKGSDRFTPKEFEIYEDIKKLVGGDLVHHMIIVFTGGDRLQGKDKFDQEVKKASAAFKSMLKDVEYRYVLVNNNATEEENRKQMAELLAFFEKVAPRMNTIDSDLLKEIEKLVEKAMRQEIAAKPEMSHEDARREVIQELTHDDTVKSKHRPVLVQIVYNYTKKSICSIL